MKKPTRIAAYAIALLLLVAAIIYWTAQAPSAEVHASPPARDPAPQPTLASTNLNVAPTPAPPPPEPTATAESRFVPIDRMGSGTNAVDGPGLVGYWYAYSDATANAFLRPRPGSQTYAPVVYLEKAAREFKGGGQSDWGAGFGFDLSERFQAKLRTKSITSSLDASRYQGIQFDAISRKDPAAIEIAFSDVNSSPKGGLCTPDTNCNADYSITVTFPNDRWQTFTVYFSQLTRPTWAMPTPGDTPPPFAKDKLYSIHFRIHPKSRGSALDDFDVLVANINFIRS